MDSLPRGKHVILDCSGAFEAEGNDILKILEEKVDESNARRVHSHVEIFDGSISPLGFAAIVLLDESHVSAHCYSEIGLLAIDIFTCGNTNPNEIADEIEKELMKLLPKLVINNRKSISRFTTTSEGYNVRNFVDTHFNHFNAGELRKCAISLNKFLNSNGKLMITLGGAMSTAEIGKSLAPLIRAGKVHAITCTGANLEEDLFNLVAQKSYKKISNWRNLSLEEEKELHDEGFNRITDICIPENEAIRHIESKIIEQWKSKSAFPHEHVFAIIEDLDADIPSDDSWVLAAKKAGIPIYVPGWEDSTLGNIFASHCLSNNCRIDAVKGGTEYMLHLANWYKNSKSPIGFLQIGGGIAGDFPICVVPFLRQDLGEKVPLWGWFAQISESSASYGGYSGALPSEKITWGKLSTETPMYIIESDATIVAPILFSYILD
jgi:deoxyhypusine synthase